MSYTLRQYFEEAQVSPIPEWFGDVPILHPVWLTPMQPRWHQVTGLNLTFSADYMRSALYDEQGTGKSLIAQAFGIWQGAVDNGTVCIMPPILLGQFRDALLASFPGIEKHLRVEIYRGTPKQRQKLVNAWEQDNWPHIVLMTYDLFRAEWPIFSHYESLVMDEAKVLGNDENKTYAAIQAFMGRIGDKYSVVMNGTPARTNLRSLYGYINFITPGTYRSKLHFDMKHVVYKKLPVRLAGDRKREIRVVDHFVNTDELYLNLYKNARRVEKKQVIEIPEKNIIPFKFDLSPAHHEAYTAFVKQKVLIFPDNTILDGTNSSALRNNAMQAVIHTDMLQVAEESAVFEAIEEIFEATGIEETKVFLLAHYQKTVEALAKRFEKYKPAVIYGPTSHRNEAEKDRFLKDPECRIAIANYVSGGVGLNLQDVCYTAIAVEPTGVPGDFDQAVDRLHRSGQQHQVNVYVLLPKGTVFVPTVATMTRRKTETSGVVSRQQLLAELLGEETAVLEQTAVEMEKSSEQSSEEGQSSDDENVAPGWNMM